MKPKRYREPDEYFSWALAICALSRGNLFVDFVKDISEPSMTDEVESLLGSVTERAVRYSLSLTEDDYPNNVSRLYCTSETKAEDLYQAIIKPLTLLNLTHAVDFNETGGFEGYPFPTSFGSFSVASSSAKPHVNNENPITASNVKEGVGTNRPTTTTPASMHSQTSPHVCILQGVERLSRKLQLLLVEAMNREVIPVKLVALMSGSDTVIVPGVTRLPKSYIFIGVSLNRPFADLDYESNKSFMEKNQQASDTLGSQDYLDRGVLPLLMDEFMLRIPILLPIRKVLKILLEDKLSHGRQHNGYDVDSIEDEEYDEQIKEHDVAVPITDNIEIHLTNPKVLRRNSFGSSTVTFQNLGSVSKKSMNIEIESKEFLNAWIKRSYKYILWPSLYKMLESDIEDPETIRFEANSTTSSKAFDNPSEIIRINNPEILKLSTDELAKLQIELAAIYVSNEVKRYIRDIISNLVDCEEIASGPDPEAFNHLLGVVKANALLEASEFCTTSHVKKVAIDVLAHRLHIQSNSCSENASSNEPRENRNPEEMQAQNGIKSAENDNAPNEKLHPYIQSRLLTMEAIAESDAQVMQ